jgi:hypothetical protein
LSDCPPSQLGDLHGNKAGVLERIIITVPRYFEPRLCL